MLIGEVNKALKSLLKYGKYLFNDSGSTSKVELQVEVNILLICIIYRDYLKTHTITSKSNSLEIFLANRPKTNKQKSKVKSKWTECSRGVDKSNRKLRICSRLNTDYKQTSQLPHTPTQIQIQIRTTNTDTDTSKYLLPLPNSPPFYKSLCMEAVSSSWI